MKGVGRPTVTNDSFHIFLKHPFILGPHHFPGGIWIPRGSRCTDAGCPVTPIHPLHSWSVHAQPVSSVPLKHAFKSKDHCFFLPLQTSWQFVVLKALKTSCHLQQVLAGREKLGEDMAMCCLHSSNVTKLKIPTYPWRKKKKKKSFSEEISVIQGEPKLSVAPIWPFLPDTNFLIQLKT